MIGRFRKKPVVISAVLWTGTNSDEIRTFAESSSSVVPDEIGIVRIRTLEGVMQAERGDWIIKGVKGEFYPCKPDIFEATYDAV